MEYRIIIETERSGKKWFYVQKKWLGLFWIYLRKYSQVLLYFDELKKAKEHIQSLIDAEYARRQSKIIKREVLITKTTNYDT